MLVADWSYQLGVALVAAALSCDAECDRHWVSDGGKVEQPPPSCPCQLVAVVTEGLELTGPPGPIGCGATHTATVRLVLDLCVEVAGKDEIADPVKINTRAAANASTRWLMLAGIVAAWSSGSLTVNTEDPPMPPALQRVWRIQPGQWRSTWSTGGMGRWEAEFKFTSDDVSYPLPLGS